MSALDLLLEGAGGAARLLGAAAEALLGAPDLPWFDRSDDDAAEDRRDPCDGY
jgi:hypothetical protein